MMRASAAILAVLLTGSPLTVLAQQGLSGPVSLELDDPALVEGLEAMPAEADGAQTIAAPDDIAASVDAANEAARPDIDDATLADMQADLRAVSADLQALRAELLASGAEGFSAAGGDSAIDRMNAMEARLAELTDRTEQLSNRIRRVVADGTNRIGDIEFRLCELDQNCDLGALMTSQLGQPAAGGALPNGGATTTPSQDQDITAMTLPPLSELQPGRTPPTEEEAREFADAEVAIEAGDWGAAIEQLDHLISAHAGGPLTPDAYYLRGVALDAGGRGNAAAESWLQGFSAAPDGPRAPASLLALSGAMEGLGAPEDACPYLVELTSRFPDAPEAAQAAQRAADAGCADSPLAEGDGDD